MKTSEMLRKDFRGDSLLVLLLNLIWLLYCLTLRSSLPPSGVLRLFRFGRPPGSQVASRPALPVSSSPPGVPGAGCCAVAPAGLVSGQAPTSRGSVRLPGPGALSGQAGFSLPLCPD